METALKYFGPTVIRVDADERVGYAPWGKFSFGPGLTKEQCKTIIRRQIKTIEAGNKLHHDMEADDIQPKLI